MRKILFFFICLSVWSTAPFAYAKQETPHRDYPNNNRGSCERMHDEGMEVLGASMEEVRALCKSNGIEL